MGRHLATALFVVCALAWLTVAGLFATEAGVWTFDGACYEPRPVWAISQAAVAVAGVGCLVVAAFGRRRYVLACAAAGLFVVWFFLFLEFATDVEKILCPGQSERSV